MEKQSHEKEFRSWAGLAVVIPIGRILGQGLNLDDEYFGGNDRPGTGDDR